MWGLFTGVMFLGTFRLNRAPASCLWHAEQFFFPGWPYGPILTGAGAGFKHFHRLEGTAYCGFSAIYAGLAPSSE